MFLNFYRQPVNLFLASLNRKHEMFLNLIIYVLTINLFFLNRKHEMFLNELEAMTLEEIET